MLRMALVQMAPRLGLIDQNLELHRDRIRHARDAGAELVVFPELSLTGYLLQDLNSEVAMRRDDPRLVGLGTEAPEASVILGFVEESDDHRLFISAALLEGGAVRHVHRKVFLANYGLFDERRFFAAGSVMQATDSAIGARLGISVCEDFWHLATPELLALDGAQILVNISSSPGRDVAAVHEVGLGTASSWRSLSRTFAQLTTSFVVFVNRVGVEESITFWGGSEVISPSGATVFAAPLLEEGLFLVDVDLSEVRRERIAVPLLRDERPEVVLRQLERIVRERAGVDSEVGEELSADVPGTAAVKAT